MAGPSFIHYRISDNIVVGVFSISQPTSAGVVEVFETHPIFHPSWASIEWRRDGVGIYTNTVVDVPSTVVDEAAELSFENLTDVQFDSPGPQVGDLLEFDGTNWVSINPSKFSTYSHVGVADNIPADGTSITHWGDQALTGDITIPVDMEVTRLSVTLSTVIATNSIVFSLVRNGGALTGSNSELTVDINSGASASIVFAIPTQFSAGDTLGVLATGLMVGPGNITAIVGVWYRDR